MGLCRDPLIRLLIRNNVDAPWSRVDAVVVGGPCSVEGCLSRHMYNSSVCYKHKGHKHEGHKHEVERAPHPTNDYTPPAWMWPFELLVQVDYLFWIILGLGVAIKWVF